MKDKEEFENYLKISLKALLDYLLKIDIESKLPYDIYKHYLFLENWANDKYENI